MIFGHEIQAMHSLKLTRVGGDFLFLFLSPEPLFLWECAFLKAVHFYFGRGVYPLRGEFCGPHFAAFSRIFPHYLAFSRIFTPYFCKVSFTLVAKIDRILFFPTPKRYAVWIFQQIYAYSPIIAFSCIFPAYFGFSA